MERTVTMSIKSVRHLSVSSTRNLWGLFASTRRVTFRPVWHSSRRFGMYPPTIFVLLMAPARHLRCWSRRAQTSIRNVDAGTVEYSLYSPKSPFDTSTPCPNWKREDRSLLSTEDLYLTSTG